MQKVNLSELSLIHREDKCREIADELIEMITTKYELTALDIESICKKLKSQGLAKARL